MADQTQAADRARLSSLLTCEFTAPPAELLDAIERLDVTDNIETVIVTAEFDHVTDVTIWQGWILTDLLLIRFRGSAALSDRAWNAETQGADRNYYITYQGLPEVTVHVRALSTIRSYTVTRSGSPIADEPGAQPVEVWTFGFDGHDDVELTIHTSRRRRTNDATADAVEAVRSALARRLG